MQHLIAKVKRLTRQCKKAEKHGQSVWSSDVILIVIRYTFQVSSKASSELSKPSISHMAVIKIYLFHEIAMR